MRIQISVFVLLVLCLLATATFAQPEERGDDGDRPRGPARERILRAFDRDGDGRLSPEEREAVRSQLGERFGQIRGQVRELFEDRRDAESGDPSPDRPDGDRERRERRRDDAGRRRDDGPREGHRRADGPGGPMRPAGESFERSLLGLFSWFDSDGDDMLNRQEFAELAQFVDRRHPRTSRGPQRMGIGRRGPARPDVERRGGFRRVERIRSFERPPRDADRDRRDGEQQDRERRGGQRRERDERRRSEDDAGRQRSNHEDNATPVPEDRSAIVESLDAV